MFTKCLGRDNLELFIRVAPKSICGPLFLKTVNENLWLFTIWHWKCFFILLKFFIIVHNKSKAETLTTKLQTQHIQNAQLLMSPNSVFLRRFERPKRSHFITNIKIH